MSGDEFERDLSPGLRRMVDEVREEQPTVDWDSLEARLFDASGELRAEHAAPAPSAQGRPRRFALTSLVGLAAAAAIAGFFALPRDRATNAPSGAPAATTVVATTAKPSRPPLMLLGGDHEARELHVGDVVEVAAVEGEWIQSAGRLRARAVGGTKLRLLEDGERMRFALERGEITADVTPVPGGEPYAIDVDGRRVAVHGTRLSVARADGAVEVAVAEGVAAIGSPGEGRTNGPEVNAGMIGRFVGLGAPELRTDPLEAARRVTRGLSTTTAAATATPTTALVAPVVRLADRSPLGAAIAAPPPAPASPLGTASAATTEPKPKTSPTAPAAAGLSATEYGPALAKVESAVKACVPRTTAGITFSIESTMTVVVAPAGGIESMSFDPPLSPQLRSCVQGAASIKFPTAPGSTTITRDVTLGSAR